MAEDQNKQITPRGDDPKFFRSLGDQVKLILRLMGDSRVSFLLKLLPAAAMVYLIFPDIIVGPVDDAVILTLGFYTFVEMCPKEVVEEHRAALRAQNEKS